MDEQELEVGLSMLLEQMEDEAADGHELLLRLTIILNQMRGLNMAVPGQRLVSAEIGDGGARRRIEATGNGPIDGYVTALRQHCARDLTLVDYHEHAVGRGADALAVAYVEMTDDAGRRACGVGRDANIVTAALKAVTGAVNRLRG